MVARHARPSHRPAQHGFTLVELLVALVVVGVLAGVALPSFLDSIRKGRRSEAFAALSAVQQSQERWRANSPAYTTTLGSGGLNLPASTSGGYYGIALASASATSYVATATAVAGKSQANDSGCQVMAVKMDGGTVFYASGVSSVDWTAADKDPKKCWAK